MIKAVFFDVANTLLHKPSVFTVIKDTLAKHDFVIDRQILEQRHKLLSESIVFPDKTSREFYNSFNAELLYALGIVPAKSLLNEIFEKCAYLPWEVCADSVVLNRLNVPMGVLSNWDSSLESKLNAFFPDKFKWIIGSEKAGVRKPSAEFYSKLVSISNLSPEDILYVGDSIKLDIEPAQQTGIRALLIDRIGIYSSCKFPVMKDMKEILSYI
jgi:HAD superfamily hydrolase (TIGR01549 family)